jgi:hypothetical protein
MKKLFLSILVMGLAVTVYAVNGIGNPGAVNVYVMNGTTNAPVSILLNDLHWTSSNDVNALDLSLSNTLAATDMKITNAVAAASAAALGSSNAMVAASNVLATATLNASNAMVAASNVLATATLNGSNAMVNASNVLALATRKLTETNIFVSGATPTQAVNFALSPLNLIFTNAQRTNLVFQLTNYTAGASATIALDSPCGINATTNFYSADGTITTNWLTAIYASPTTNKSARIWLRVDYTSPSTNVTIRHQEQP